MTKSPQEWRFCHVIFSTLKPATSRGFFLYLDFKIKDPPYRGITMELLHQLLFFLESGNGDFLDGKGRVVAFDDGVHPYGKVVEKK